MQRHIRIFWSGSGMGKDMGSAGDLETKSFECGAMVFSRMLLRCLIPAL